MVRLALAVASTVCSSWIDRDLILCVLSTWSSPECGCTLPSAIDRPSTSAPASWHTSTTWPTRWCAGVRTERPTMSTRTNRAKAGRRRWRMSRIRRRRRQVQQRRRMASLRIRPHRQVSLAPFPPLSLHPKAKRRIFRCRRGPSASRMPASIRDASSRRSSRQCGGSERRCGLQCEVPSPTSLTILSCVDSPHSSRLPVEASIRTRRSASSAGVSARMTCKPSWPPAGTCAQAVRCSSPTEAGRPSSCQTVGVGSKEIAHVAPT